MDYSFESLPADLQEIFEYFYPEDTPLRRLLLKHSFQVAEKALDIAGKLPENFVDKSVVFKGALLHDIGVGMCHAPRILCTGQLNYICHGCAGSSMLRKYGAEKGADLEVYALICERHTGSGITAAEVRQQALPLEIRDYLPLSREEKLIALADKFFSKSGNMAEKSLSRIRASMAEFGAASLERFDALCDLFGVDHAEN